VLLLGRKEFEGGAGGDKEREAIGKEGRAAFTVRDGTHRVRCGALLWVGFGIEARDTDWDCPFERYITFWLALGFLIER